jgi:hypothetical protein
VCCTLCRLSSDGEEYFENPDTYEEQQDQQQFMNQGKYSMGLPWCPIYYIIYSLCMCLILLNYKDILVFDDLYLDPYGFYLHMGRMLVLQLNMIYTMTDGTNG